MEEPIRFMLDAYIIEEIKRRERDRQQRDRARPVLELPQYPDRQQDRRHDRDEAPSSGETVVQIDL
jgi:hypothetical protein